MPGAQHQRRDDHQDCQYHRRGDRELAHPALGISLDKFTQPKAGHDRDQLELRQPRAIAFGAEIRRQRLQQPGVAAAVQQFGVKRGFGGAFDKRRQDPGIAMPGAEHGDFPPHPFRLRRMRRAQHDKIGR